MSDLTQLSHACGEALADAEAAGAKIAAHFLRVQVRELFRECQHRRAAAGGDCASCEFHPHDIPITRRHEHG
jgi:hypothetical protein